MTDTTLHKPVQTDRTGQTEALQSVSVSPCDIEAKGLTKDFAGTPVFADLTFRLARGESVALVGANGTGKSTLLRCLMGLIPATGGEISLLGTQLPKAGQSRKRALVRSLRSQIGLVSQKHNLVPRLSVLSNVLQGLLGQRPGIRHWSHVFAPQSSRDEGMAALDQVGLAHLATRRADRLSGGQSQRVAIARALVGQPKILVADEPCASLDPAAGEDVMELFFQLARQRGVTVVFTSHNTDHALRYGDRVLGLAKGRMELDATASSLSQSDLRGLYD